MASTYPGVRDGLYEANGTYGGSEGLEVLAQMVGTPMTCDTWLLMILVTVWIAAAQGLFLWALEWVRPRNVLGLPMTGPGAQTGSGTGRQSSRSAIAMRIGNDVLRLVLSYFTLPLVTLSTHQLSYLGMLGAGHTALALVVLVLILLSFAWLVFRLPAASLGALVFEAKHRYQRLEGGDEDSGMDFDEKQTRRDRGFILTLFVLNIARGLTIGGLQQWGVIQLALLMAFVTILWETMYKCLACASYSVVKLLHLAGTMTFI
ncbi:uncharacterized protein CTRU02_204996 [Colletotrichum truncatum]|uniref:Integral membrane protein n=1 Tax=Colletotrichum truncatum TaxID=5467 RepID=A0ACC3Z2S7_COLTU